MTEVLLLGSLLGLEVPAADDFSNRCAGAGVVRCLAFDTPGQIAGHTFPAWDNVSRMFIDQSVASSGGGSLRFDLPSLAAANTSGSVWFNFMDDLSVQFGEGQEFFLQWRQRFSPGMLTEFRRAGGGQTGWKQIIVGEGDQPSQPTAYSCTELELVTQQDSRYMGASLYHSCGRFVGLDFYDGTQVRMQHQGPPYCHYPDDPQRGCFRYASDEWMTFQYHVQIGTWNTPSSRVRLFAARQGQPSVTIFDSAISHPGGFVLYNNPGSGSGTNPGAKYGKFWLLPYTTARDSSVAYPAASTWYDEVIISRQRIADPDAPVPTSPPRAPSQLRVVPGDLVAAVAGLQER